ncbi:hypothetical protein G6F40_015940 [Rhizopus arrhizus]|nr:hypothetical protein G6F40_015940 [Rhizopus arrhizus]
MREMPARTVPSMGCRMSSRPVSVRVAARQRSSHCLSGSVAVSNSADKRSSPAGPRLPASRAPSNGPHKPPALAPAAISANRRLADSMRNTSAIRLQAMETTNRLNTDSQT